MNILFVEDIRELRESGVAQLELLGHTVYPVSDLAAAREVMMNPSMPVKLVIADHALPDGQGLHFITEMKPLFTKCIYVLVSGCLTANNIKECEENDIPYYHKPLLYGKLVEKLRHEHVKEAKAPSEAAAAAAAPVEKDVAPEEVAEDEPEAPKRKKWFGVW